MTTQQFSGTLTAADHKTHVPVVFEVPPGTTRLSGSVSLKPQSAPGFDHLVSISLFAPDGARGARHNNPDKNFRIDAAHASPGFLPGPVKAGHWMLFLDVFRLLGETPLAYEVRIDCESVDVAPASDNAAVAVRSNGPRWYRGDLHAHSLHSDGSWETSDLVNWARRRGLDFVTLSDHNTVSGVAAARESAAEDLLVISGMELTTHHGHALSLGGGWSEWRTGPVTGKTMPMLVGDITAAGKTFVIAHPRIPGDPECTGCRWEYVDMMPGPARVVEIWNAGHWSDYNEEGLALYRQWLAAGHRLAATAGSDRHGGYDADGETGFNHVFADELSEPAILSAVAAGRNYLSSGPRLVLSAPQPDGTVVPMGGTAPRRRGVVVSWRADDEALLLALVGPEGPAASMPIAAGSEGEVAFAAVPRGFVQAELRNGQGRLRAVTNPIYTLD